MNRDAHVILDEARDFYVREIAELAFEPNEERRESLARLRTLATVLDEGYDFRWASTDAARVDTVAAGILGSDANGKHVIVLERPAAVAVIDSLHLREPAMLTTVLLAMVLNGSASDELVGVARHGTKLMAPSSPTAAGPLPQRTPRSARVQGTDPAPTPPARP